MTPLTSKKAQNSPRPASIDLSNRLFFEADQLRSEAYELLGEIPISNNAMKRFIELKKMADDKYLQAQREWLRTKGKVEQ